MKIDIKELKYWIAQCQETGEIADLQGINLCWVDLQGIDLHWVDLQYAELREANLQGADLQYAELREANLHGANLRGANLRGANLRGANLQGAYLQGADLQGANLQGANLQETSVQKILGHPWEITVYPESLGIGCERHTIQEWEDYTDEDIDKMDSRALSWWKNWKDLILAT